MTDAIDSDRVDIGWAVVAAFFVLLLGGLLTDHGAWFQSLAQPEFRPPGWLFLPAWLAIFGLAVVSFAMFSRGGPDEYRRRLVTLVFLGNGLANVAWSFLFFKLQRPDLALIDLGVLAASVVALMAFILPVSRGAAAALLPYLAWLVFAGSLNFEVVRLNGPF